MPTAREIKKLLRPLLSRRSDLVQFRRSICFVPFTRYSRGVAFKMHLFSTRSLICPFANQLCDGAWDVDVVREGPAEIPENWEDDVEGTAQRLCAELERDILPTIEPVTSFEEHLKRFPRSLHVYEPSDRSDRYDFQFACTACTRGDFDRAEAVMTELLDPKIFFFGVPEVVTEEHRFAIPRQERMAYFLMTLRKGRAETLTLLHDWEAFSVKSMRLEKYWEPSPFPCEL
jgi:hypothetical protein